ncbi:MAG: chromosomal replication initiator protein DnaA, partial [Oscillospiraceae bacterium]|nr:chromosomal replication initiator protein DnaA [Oscillospiraceae bacterium]
MNSVNDIWAGIMDMLSATLTPTSINTWFAECMPVEVADGRLVIYTPSRFKRDIIQDRFAQTIKDSLSELFSAPFDLLILTGDELEDYKRDRESSSTLPEMDGYTFENFIVGPSNKFAHAAAISVTKSPGSKSHNPLFIYGHSGLGKTHLLLAIGAEIHSSVPAAKICYIKGAE